MSKESRQQSFHGGEQQSAHLKKEDAMKEKTMVRLLTAEKGTGYITEAELMDVIKNFDAVKENIWVHLANAIWDNSKDCPQREVEGTDLMAVFRIMLHVQGKGQSSILVKNGLMDAWNIDLECLYETALKNTMEQAPARVISTGDMIDYGEEKSKRPEEVSCEDEETYILENPGATGGAAAMLYPGVLQTIAEKRGSNLFIVPTSINEVLIIDDDGKSDPQTLQRMLMESNIGIVARRAILSDQVFYYDRKEKKISTATTPEGTWELQMELDNFSRMFYP